MRTHWRGIRCDPTTWCRTRSSAHGRAAGNGTDLRAWVFAILHNVFISDMRRFAARGYDPDAIDAEDRIDASTDRSHHAGVMLDIERALAALSAEQRAVVLLVGR